MNVNTENYKTELEEEKSENSQISLTFECNKHPNEEYSYYC